MPRLTLPLSLFLSSEGRKGEEGGGDGSELFRLDFKSGYAPGFDS
jgi:hypothetical protein